MKSDTIGKFNRDTLWLATGLLGTVVFAALVLAFQERRPEATQADRDLLLNANPATVANAVAKNSSSNGKMTAGPGRSVDHVFTKNPLQEIPSAQMEPAVSTPTPLPAFIPEISRNGYRQDSEQVREPKARNVSNRSSAASRYVAIKRRLIEI